MFLSKDHLIINFDIDPEIAAYFVDRPVPADNWYWKDKYLYMRHKAGYLFIPLFTDILFRMGIAKENLLGNEFVGAFENILNGAAKEEFGHQTENSHIQNTYQMVTMLPDVSQEWMAVMEKHFIRHELKLPFQPDANALCRADSFLLAVGVLPLNEINQDDVFRYWYALVGFFLLMDDIEDFEKDKKDGDKNSLIEWGSGETASAKAGALIQQFVESLVNINPKLSQYCNRLLEKFTISHRLQQIAAS